MKTEEDQRMEQIFERVYAQAKGTGSFLEEWLKPEMPINQDMNHRAAQIVCGAGYGSSFVIGKKLGIGYNTSSKLVEVLQEAGILGEFDLETRRFPLLRSIGFY
jgi:hypothetical protein